MNIILITGILLIAFYFVLSRIAEHRNVYRKNLHRLESSKTYSNSLFKRIKGEMIMVLAMAFLIIGIFLCLSFLYQLRIQLSFNK